MRSLLTICFVLALACPLTIPTQGQILSLSRDEMIELTKLNWQCSRGSFGERPGLGIRVRARAGMSAGSAN